MKLSVTFSLQLLYKSILTKVNSNLVLGLIDNIITITKHICNLIDK